MTMVVELLFLHLIDLISHRLDIGFLIGWHILYAWSVPSNILP